MRDVDMDCLCDSDDNYSFYTAQPYYADQNYPVNVTAPGVDYGEFTEADWF